MDLVFTANLIMLSLLMVAVKVGIGKSPNAYLVRLDGCLIIMEYVSPSMIFAELMMIQEPAHLATEAMIMFKEDVNFLLQIINHFQMMAAKYGTGIPILAQLALTGGF